MGKQTIPQGFRPVRHDRLIQEDVHDPYMTKGKLEEPTVCPQCKAVYSEGRWHWGSHPKIAHEALCPACHRVKDKFPAGFVTLEGEYFKSHHGEIMSLVSHEAEREREAHPLKRIMEIQEQDGSVLITTSDIHLAREIGDAVEKAYKGMLEYHYNPQENLLRVHWIH